MEDEALHQLQHEQSKLLDKIDELRTIGVGGLVELPQLIVCGNQSSGKSSVLEAISRVRFPVKSNVCTRFATEVILRRNPSSKIKVSIEPGSSRKKEQERLNLRSFTHDEFSNNNDLKFLIERAKERMGITESSDSGFSDDVLKVEISGPDKPELTMVDLPGLYYSTSQDQGPQGIKTVHDLTEKYMRNSRSIILAVISAKADYHVQRVLNIAERLDPNRERTLGVVTHPDIPDANSEEEQTYLQFIKNEKIPLRLGWHALRNRPFETQKSSDDARDETEKTFFNQGRWTSLPRECVGIDSLRRRLSSILLKHIRRNLPNLIADIQEKVSDREQKLFKLGPARPTLQQQKGFLLNISGNFERITGQALNGLYTDEFFGGLDDTTSEPDFRRLRAVIRNLNEGFADTMAHRGSLRKIIEPHDHGIYPAISNNHVRRHVLEREISDQARTNRGIELPGSANQFLVGNLFRDQSKPWEGLAKDHLMQAWESARYFVILVLRHFADDHTCSLLIGTVIESELEKLKQALFDKLAELTAYTKRGHPLPVGKSFLTQIQKARSERQLQLLKGKLSQFSKHDGESGYTTKDIEQATLALESSRDEFAAAEIIDQMQAYYETVIVTFVDNVATLGIENSLLDPLQRIFTCQVINNMEDDQVRELATEPSYIREERDRLMSELAKLQAGLRTLNIFNIQMPSLGGRPLSSMFLVFSSENQKLTTK
ncbi:dynamin GTPase [Aspergillus sp. HF37]|nr:dynamin GTPase [Aspergillus sp. HF37]